MCVFVALLHCCTSALYCIIVQMREFDTKFLAGVLFRVGNLAFFKPNFGNLALFSSCWLRKLSLAFWLNFGFFGDSGQFSFNSLHTSLNF